MRAAFTTPSGDARREQHKGPLLAAADGVGAGYVAEQGGRLTKVE